MNSPEIGHGAARIKVGKNVDGSVLKLLGAERSGINDTAPDSNRTSVESTFTLCDTSALHQPAVLQRRVAVEGSLRAERQRPSFFHCVRTAESEDMQQIARSAGQAR